MYPDNSSYQGKMEIERKFLVKKLPENIVFDSQQIEQGYLCLGNKEEVRLRHTYRNDKDEYFLTVKKGTGLIRGEYEVSIPVSTFFTLWPCTSERRVSKKRMRMVDNDVIIDIDVYEGHLSGLVTAEVEFTSKEEALKFTSPSWIEKEVTEDERYKNRELATKGIPSPL